jgi:hypothetical protein
MRVEVKLYAFLTSALYVSGQLHVPVALTKYPLNMKLNGPQSWSGCGGGEKNSFSAPAGNRTPIMQLIVTSHYID